MIVTHKLSPMDLTCRGVTQRIDVVQDDRYSRNLEFTLTQNGEAWTIPTAAAAVVRFKKSDGTGGNYDTLPDGSLAYSFSGNVLTVTDGNNGSFTQKFAIYADGTKRAETTAASYDLSALGLSAGTYAITVKAVGSGMTDSAASNSVSYTVIQIYTITPTLTNVTAAASNPSSIAAGSTATLTFTANSGYTLPDTVTVTGATGVWDKATGKLTISNLTGNVRFSITGVAVPSGYTLTVTDEGCNHWDAHAQLTKSDGSTLEIDGTAGTYENIKSIDIASANFGYWINGVGSAALPYELSGATTLHFYSVCLTGDMLVTLSDGSEKPVSELTDADTYTAYDLMTGKPVTDVKARYFDARDGHSGKFADRYQKYTFSDGTVIQEVHKHRFLNLERMEFINLCHWNIGDRIYKLDGTTPALVSKEVVIGTVEHFTVTTANYHNGFVQGCLYGDRHTQKYKIVMVNGKPVYDTTQPHTVDYLYGEIAGED